MSKDQNQHDVELVMVTPEVAHDWLGYNIHNRKLRERVVNAYAADMAAGDWQWNGESIKFGADCALLDGQHRLAAIVKADVTLPMLVVRGLPRETQDTVDGGAKRKFNDVLQLRGEAHATSLAAIVRRVALWEAGFRRSLGNVALTNAQMLQTLDKYPEIREIPVLAEHASRGCGLPASICGLGYWLFGRVETDDPDQLASDVQHFFDRLHDGQNLTKGNPIYELRRTVESSRTVRGERSQAYLTAIMIKAWNAYRDGATISLLRYKPGGASPERYPEPR